MSRALDQDVLTDSVLHLRISKSSLGVDRVPFGGLKMMVLFHQAVRSELPVQVGSRTYISKPQTLVLSRLGMRSFSRGGVSTDKMERWVGLLWKRGS